MIALVSSTRMPASVRPQATTAVISELTRGIAPVRNQGTPVEVSNSAATASEMFAAANKFVKDEHIEPFDGYVRGRVSPGAYLNVERYNNYIFNKAADDMVTKAVSAGLQLSKTDIVEALKSSNSIIASIKNDESARVTNLGQGSVLSHLHTSDLDSLTDMYIAGKEAGLDISVVAGLAGEMGIANKYQSEGTVIVVHDPEREKAGLPYLDTTQKVSAGSEDKFDQIKLSLYGKLGLSTLMVNLLVDNIKIGNNSEISTLQFIQSILAVTNKNAIIEK